MKKGPKNGPLVIPLGLEPNSWCCDVAGWGIPYTRSNINRTFAKS